MRQVRAVLTRAARGRQISATGLAREAPRGSRGFELESSCFQNKRSNPRGGDGGGPPCRGKLLTHVPNRTRIALPCLLTSSASSRLRRKAHRPPGRASTSVGFTGGKATEKNRPQARAPLRVFPAAPPVHRAAWAAGLSPLCGKPGAGLFPEACQVGGAAADLKEEEQVQRGARLGRGPDPAASPLSPSGGSPSVPRTLRSTGGCLAVPKTPSLHHGGEIPGE